MKKNDLDVPAWLNLSLLDDATTTLVFRRQPAFTPFPAKPVPAIRSAVQRAAQTASAIRATTPTAKKSLPAAKVFRDRPTLREMMSEYNRRSTFRSSKLLKNAFLRKPRFHRGVGAFRL